MEQNISLIALGDLFKASLAESEVTMKILAVDFTITADTVVAIVGVAITAVIAIVGAIYAIVTNTKRYELTECYRKELLEWYTKTVEIMIALIHHAKFDDPHTQESIAKKTELLSRLSVQVEVGRFYFPNVDRKDRFGDHKPSAYRGRRHIVLELLLHFYKTASWEDCGAKIGTLRECERHFTSILFDTIEPRKRNKLYSKYTALAVPEGKTLGDFLSENPEHLYVFGGKRRT